MNKKNKDITWTASSGDVANFRYAVFYKPYCSKKRRGRGRIIGVVDLKGTKTGEDKTKCEYCGRKTEDPVKAYGAYFCNKDCLYAWENIMEQTEAYIIDSTEDY